MINSETLNIILNGQDYNSLNVDDKMHYIKGALMSLRDSLQYGLYTDRKSVINEIQYLEELKKTVV